jgi:hypothetical protein
VILFALKLIVDFASLGVFIVGVAFFSVEDN